MRLFIEGKEAALKKGSSIEYTEENFLFSDAEEYTFGISLPLEGCEQNRGIFGWMNRPEFDFPREAERREARLVCENIDRRGVVTVTECSREEVKVQFLAGRSAENFSADFDKIYVNELSIPYPQDRKARNPRGGQIPGMEPGALLQPWPHRGWVAMPWVNNTTGNMQNGIRYDGTKEDPWEWEEGVRNLSFQPYLIWLLHRICEEVGYTCDTTNIEQGKHRFLLVCNALPQAWDETDFAKALPNWTLTEFLRQLEMFLAGEFRIDHRRKTISFRYNKETLEAAGTVHLHSVLDDFSVDVAADKADAKYKGLLNYGFAGNGDPDWVYLDCPWVIRRHGGQARRFDTFRELLEFAGRHETGEQTGPATGWGSGTGTIVWYTQGVKETDTLLYARDIDTYFAMRAFRSYKDTASVQTPRGTRQYDYWAYAYTLQPINIFGGTGDEEAERKEVKVVPAWIGRTDELATDLKQFPFLECGEYAGVVREEEEYDYTGNGRDTFGTQDFRAGDNTVIKQARKGEKGEKGSAVFDRLYMGFWDGIWNGNRPPCPIVDRAVVWKNGIENSFVSGHDMRMGAQAAGGERALPAIDPLRRYRFSFLAETLPDRNAVFIIRGKRYLCAKLSATLTEQGMSRLIKGEFYRIRS